MLRVCVFGSGGWGTALAQLCAVRGYRVVQWVRESEVLESINEKKLNPLFLPEVPLSPGIVATRDEREAVDGADLVLLVTPSQFMREVVLRIR